MDLPRPHDLLFPRRPEAFDAGGARPDWLEAGWMARAPLVVRRAPITAAAIPVGARGLDRNQRCAGHLAVDAIARRVTPEMLARAVLGPGGPALDLHTAATGLPCVAALIKLAPKLRALGLDWGPAGGVGFWLASGLPVLRPTSDLDLLVRAPRPLSLDLAGALRVLVEGAGCRADVQIDTGSGGFALLDYLRGGRVMLKTANGPLLVADPWRIEEPA